MRAPASAAASRAGELASTRLPRLARPAARRAAASARWAAALPADPADRAAAGARAVRSLRRLRLLAGAARLRPAAAVRAPAPRGRRPRRAVAPQLGAAARGRRAAAAAPPPRWTWSTAPRRALRRSGRSARRWSATRASPRWSSTTRCSTRDLRRPGGAAARRARRRRGSRGYWAYAGAGAAGAPPAPEVAAYTALMAASQPHGRGGGARRLPDLRRHRCLLDVGGGDGTFLARRRRARARTCG